MILAVLLLLAQADPVERYLAEKDKAARARILAEIRQPLPQVEVELRKPPRRLPPELRGQVVKKRLKADHPLAVDFEYCLWVPADYVPDRPWRMIVSLHGQNGNGESFLRNWLPDLQREGQTFLLCPSAGRGGWGHSLLGHHYVLDSMRDVMDSYAIDPDLVFLDGASMGGNGSFQLVCGYPDRFAGAAPRSGGPLFRYVDKKSGAVTAEGLQNLLATPIYWVVGAKDAEVPNAWVQIGKAQLDALKSDFRFKEYPDGGHEWFPQENAAVLAWMGTKRRDDAPPRVGLESNDPLFARSFWLEIAEFEGKRNLKRNYLDFDKKVIEERLLYPEHARVTAELSREANEIRITASGARDLKVYLNSKMLDLAKPVTLNVNGSRSTQTPKPSLEVLLESARRDRGLLYSAVLKVKVP